MSSIEKLLIRGVRAFNPHEPSAIEFYTPLTLIVGHNGSGKTVRRMRLAGWRETDVLIPLPRQSLNA